MRKESVGGGSSEKSPSGAPGSSWSSKKFHEEYERAMTGVLDKDWDHGKFYLLLSVGGERGQERR
jgi:hypothetical protein